MDVFGLEFIEGRNFSAKFALDRSHDNIIVNEQAVKQLGIHGSALGHKILRHYGKEQTIIGVVKDFHTSSLHEQILPTVLVYESQAWYAVVKLSGGQIPQTLARIEEIWDEFVPDKPIDFYFIDEAIDQLYHSETNFKSILSIMTGIIIIIACLGLFGLVAYTAEQRRKEIGIRKVLGATVSNVITLLSGEFVMLVVLANLIAWPAAWIMMNKWLQNFAYHIEMTWWTFVMAGSVVLMIALFTAAIQAIRAAIANPVESLRYE